MRAAADAVFSFVYLTLLATVIVAAVFDLGWTILIGAQLLVFVAWFFGPRRAVFRRRAMAWAFYLAWHCIMVAGLVGSIFLVEASAQQIELAVFLVVMFIALPRRVFQSM